MVERTEEIKKITIDFYENFAEKYWERHAKPPVESIDRFVNLLPRPNSRILDLGCGGGRDSIALQLLGLNTVCVDISTKMCAGAKTNQLSVIQADQEGICFKKESFDGVWSRVSLLHSPPHLMIGILKEIREILRPSGAFFLGMKSSNKVDVEIELKISENGTTYYCYWPPDMLCGIMKNIGFEIRDLIIRGKDFFGERDYFDIFAIKNGRRSALFVTLTVDKQFC